MRVDAGLAKEIEDGDYDGLVAVIGHLMAVKDRTPNTDNMLEPLKQTIDLLKTYEQEMSDQVHTLLEELPDQWTNLKKVAADSEAGRRATPSERSGDHSKEVLVVRREAARVPRALSTNRAACVQFVKRVRASRSAARRCRRARTRNGRPTRIGVAVRGKHARLSATESVPSTRSRSTEATVGRRRIGSQFDRGVEDDAVATGQRRNDGHRFEEIRQGHSRSRQGDARLGRVQWRRFDR